MDIIQTNPYRILGICSNSPIRERVANRKRLNAFLKVGKPVSLPMDLPQLLSTINRSPEIVTEADAKLTLPNEQLRYAQFWFIKVSPFDEIALNHLIVGNMENAISIWQKKENASSLQNRIVCALIRNDYVLAISYGERLYSLYSFDFVNAILGDNITVSSEHLEYDFIDVLCREFGFSQVLSQTSNEDWKEYVRNKSVQPLMDTLQSAIETAKSSKRKGAKARLSGGTKLMNDTEAVLKQLKTLLPVTDLQYQMIADKLGLEILQCGIDYYNDSEEPDAAHKAMVLQSYAQSIVVGKMAKDRCKENVDILNKIIQELPPMEVYNEDEAIKEELKKFSQLPDKICHAVTLLTNCQPHLQVIKDILGGSNVYYLNISTQVVAGALYNVIEEVNEVQNQIQIGLIIDRDRTVLQVKSILKAAWEATKLMDAFGMETDFKLNRYNENRQILKNLCDQIGVFVQPKKTLQYPINHSSSSKDGTGCMGIVAFVIFLIIIDLCF